MKVLQHLAPKNVHQSVFPYLRFYPPNPPVAPPAFTVDGALETLSPYLAENLNQNGIDYPYPEEDIFMLVQGSTTF